MVICEYAYVDSVASKASPGQLGAHDDNLIPSLARMADTIKLAGARAAMQISHSGRQKFAGSDAIAPSPVPWKRLGQTGLVEPREATLEDIEQIVEAYGRAALRVKLAGFDLVEIHAGHGYLVTQFLSPRTNFRTDAYGGSVEARTRFLLEVIARVRGYVGPTFPLSVRLSHTEFVQGGFTLPDTLHLVRKFDGWGVDAVHVSAGVHESTERQIPPIYLPRRSNEAASKEVKKATNLPVIVVGAINTPQDAEAILASGAADFVALGRALLADPEFPVKARLGHVADIRPCIRCNDGCLDRPRATLQGTQCSVNFAVGREDEFGGDATVERSPVSRRIAVVGGGPGGLEAARIAALRGHHVTLFEQGALLGGRLRVASTPDFKADLRAYLEYLTHQVSVVGVRVRLATRLTAAALIAERPDAIVLATGSRESEPRIPSSGSPNVLSATSVLEGAATTGKAIVVVGADQTAIDTTLYLADQGRNVTLIHEAANFAPALDEGARNVVRARFRDAQVTVHLSERVTELRDSRVTTRTWAGVEHHRAADTVVISRPLVPNNELRRPLEQAGHEPWMVGDCVTPRKIHDAVHEAHNVALRL
jgi:2,4-dienoyl-CoA reductase-like NADH-dependent reductase (Old Yellow Enzyme family)/thioredoxin reductase